MQEFVAQIKGATHVSFTRSDDGPDLITMALSYNACVLPSYEVPLKQMTTKDGLTTMKLKILQTSVLMIVTKVIIQACFS